MRYVFKLSQNQIQKITFKIIRSLNKKSAEIGLNVINKKKKFLVFIQLQKQFFQECNFNV